MSELYSIFTIIVSHYNYHIACISLEEQGLGSDVILFEKKEFYP